MIIVGKLVPTEQLFQSHLMIQREQKTAEQAKSWYPEAAQVLKDNTHIDDTCDSVCSNSKPRDWRLLTVKGGFQVNGWISNWSLENEITEQEKLKMKLLQDTTQEKIPGTVWKHAKDVLLFDVTHPKLLLLPKGQYWGPKNLTETWHRTGYHLGQHVAT